ncbi:MAG TPA: hypothetical protein DHV36_08290 [Desulfobacteraceae bacterium]|nr:hypothetical protein [Desulfobacteraceae bacterium]
MEETRKDTILVVDDTEANIDILLDILEGDYEVGVATDGESALEAVAEELPDLILLDIMMPVMDGYQVCEQLQSDEKTRDIPVIFVTALEQQESETRGLGLGAVDYITKPFNPEIVRLRVENHLKLVRANQALKRQNEILIENERLRNDVESIARHDLKTPMNALISIPELLLKEKGVTENQREMLEMIAQSGFRVMDIINSSIDLYRMEKGEYRLRPVPIDLLKILKQLKGEIIHLMGEKEIPFRILIGGKYAKEDDSFIVYGEEMLYYSLFVNLVKNAVEASPPGRSVTVGLDIKGDTPIIMVNNTGLIPDEIRDTFFDKYVTHGKPDGTGLGTYSAKLITKTLGGEISFQSVEEKGTTLMVELHDNLKKENAEEAFDKFFEQSPLQIKNLSKKTNMTIMILDDYAIMRGTIVSILRQMGFKNFIRGADGMEGLKQLQVKQVDLIISDLNMPKVNGLQLLKHVKKSETLGHIPFMMVSGEAEQRKVEQAVKLGVDAFVVKPFSADILMKKLARVLDRADQQEG